LRSFAAASNTTITEALRREVVSRHPNIGPAWPEKVRTAKQLAYAKRRTTIAVDSNLRMALTRAAVIIQKLLEDNQRVRPAAREFVEKWK